MSLRNWKPTSTVCLFVGASGKIMARSLSVVLSSRFLLSVCSSLSSSSPSRSIFLTFFLYLLLTFSLPFSSIIGLLLSVFLSFTDPPSLHLPLSSLHPPPSLPSLPAPSSLLPYIPLSQPCRRSTAPWGGQSSCSAPETGIPRQTRDTAKTAAYVLLILAKTAACILFCDI